MRYIGYKLKNKDPVARYFLPYIIEIAYAYEIQFCTIDVDREYWIYEEPLCPKKLYDSDLFQELIIKRD